MNLCFIIRRLRNSFILEIQHANVTNCKSLTNLFLLLFFLCFFQVTNENELFLLESNVLRTTEYCVTDLTYHVIYNTPRTTEYCVTDLTHHVIYNTPL